MSDWMQFRAEGAEEVAGKLERFTRGYSQAVHKGMTKALLFVHSKAPSYPAPPPQSTYRRTGTLGRSLTALQGGAPGAISKVRGLGKDIQGIWGSRIDYAQYVVDQGKQAKAHVGRWFTLQTVIKEHQGQIKVILEQGTAELLRESKLT